MAKTGRRLPATPKNPVVEALLDGSDLALMLPASAAPGWLDVAVQHARRGALLVVPSELVAERESRLRGRVPVLRIDASLRPSERKAALDRLGTRGPRIVLSDPEALHTHEVCEALARTRLAFVVTEQGQRASPHAHDFDPAFSSMAATLVRSSTAPRVVVFGATTRAARADAAIAFGLRTPLTMAAPVCPESVTLQTVRATRRDPALADQVASLPRPGVVFCATPQDADAAYAELRARRVPVHRYHAGMSPGERGGELIQFTLPGRRAVLVATSAFAAAPLGASDPPQRGFGVGFEERELRFVAHFQAPASLEQYAREVGLAARAKSATCLLAYDPQTRQIAESELRAARPSADAVRACQVALGEQSRDGYTTLERVALAAKLGRRDVELAVNVLARAGLVKYGSGWVRAGVPGGAFAEGAGRLASTLDQLRQDAVRRLDAVDAYATSAGCLPAFLDRYFEIEGAAACGRCSGCMAASPRSRRGAVGRGAARTARAG